MIQFFIGLLISLTYFGAQVAIVSVAAVFVATAIIRVLLLAAQPKQPPIAK